MSMDIFFPDEDWTCDHACEKLINGLFGKRNFLSSTDHSLASADSTTTPKRLKKYSDKIKADGAKHCNILGSCGKKNTCESSSDVLINNNISELQNQPVKKSKDYISKKCINSSQNARNSSINLSTRTKFESDKNSNFIQTKPLECKKRKRCDTDPHIGGVIHNTINDHVTNQITILRKPNKRNKYKKNVNNAFEGKDGGKFCNNVSSDNKLHVNDFISNVDCFSEKPSSFNSSTFEKSAVCLSTKKKKRKKISKTFDSVIHGHTENEDEVTESQDLPSIIPQLHHTGNYNDNSTVKCSVKQLSNQHYSEISSKKNKLLQNNHHKRKRDDSPGYKIITKDDQAGKKIQKLDSNEKPLDKSRYTDEKVVNSLETKAEQFSKLNMEPICKKQLLKKEKLKSHVSHNLNHSLLKTPTFHDLTPKPTINTQINANVNYPKTAKNNCISLVIQNSTNKHIPSSSILKNKALEKLRAARFRFLNEKMYTSTGSETLNYFLSDPESFQVYHQGFQEQTTKWPVNPVDVIIEDIKNMPDNLVIADLGCGDAKIARSFPQRKVKSFDFISLNENVIACDMGKIPVENCSVDIVVFCLSLMGTNINDYICEAHRILKMGGLMKIAEVESRIDEESFTNSLLKFGFDLIKKNCSNKVFIFLVLKKVKKKLKRKKLPVLQLKPCFYKKR